MRLKEDGAGELRLPEPGAVEMRPIEPSAGASTLELSATIGRSGLIVVTTAPLASSMTRASQTAL